MFCRYCGKQISDAAEFCPFCGTAVKIEVVWKPAEPQKPQNTKEQRTSQRSALQQILAKVFNPRGWDEMTKEIAINVVFVGLAVFVGINIAFNLHVWIECCMMIIGLDEIWRGIIFSLGLAAYYFKTAYDGIMHIKYMVTMLDKPRKLIEFKDWLFVLVPTVLILFAICLGGNTFIREKRSIQLVKDMHFSELSGSVGSIMNMGLADQEWECKETSKNTYKVTVTGYSPEYKERLTFTFENKIQGWTENKFEWSVVLEQATFVESHLKYYGGEAAWVLKQLD